MTLRRIMRLSKVSISIRRRSSCSSRPGRSSSMRVVLSISLRRRVSRCVWGAIPSRFRRRVFRWIISSAAFAIRGPQRSIIRRSRRRMLFVRILLSSPGRITISPWSSRGSVSPGSRSRRMVWRRSICPPHSVRGLVSTISPPHSIRPTSPSSAAVTSPSSRSAQPGF